MEEHIFGTYATDELKLVHHRAMRRGLQHWHALTPRDPEPGQPVTVTVRIGPDLPVTQAAVYYTLDGSEPVGARGQAANGFAVPLTCRAVAWDSLVWDYIATWQADIPAQPAGAVVRYQIGGWNDNAAESGEVYADWPDAQRTAEMAAAAFFQGVDPPHLQPGDPARGKTFTYHVDRLSPPAWAREAVIYQIFVDRFSPGQGRDWQQTEDVKKPCGGTLWGIAEQIDYLHDLGVNCLWLTPIFPSPSHHRYDATDYRRVAPQLGGENALRALVAAAHARGIRVILDLVCNHLSLQHPVFQEALRDPASPYRGWFSFDDSPAGYRAFFGSRHMPQLDFYHPAARAWMLDHARFWLREFDVDGYRLDYGNGPGPDFWSDFWAVCKAEKADCFCFGEIVEAPDTLLSYVGRLDGVLDFPLEAALRKTYGLGEWTEAEFERFVARHLAYFPEDFLMPAFLDNHDTNRFLFIAGGDKDALKRAAAAQMRLPGPPIIYYGTEVGLSQRRGNGGYGLDAAREVMVWGDAQDRDLLECYRGLIRERRARRS